MGMQISTELLDGVVLAVLERGDAYGYVLTQEIQEKITVSPSTLYPVLRRLLEQGLVETYDKPIQGRNRRYYKVTEAGVQRKNTIAAEWHEFKEQIEYFMSMEKKEDHEQRGEEDDK